MCDLPGFGAVTASKHQYLYLGQQVHVHWLQNHKVEIHFRTSFVNDVVLPLQHQNRSETRAVRSHL